MSPKDPSPLLPSPSLDASDIPIINIISAHKIAKKTSQCLRLLYPELSSSAAAAAAGVAGSTSTATKTVSGEKSAIGEKREAEEKKVERERKEGGGGGVVALRARSPVAGKAVSIAEIVKRRVTEAGDVWFQYSKLDSIVEEAPVKRKNSGKLPSWLEAVLADTEALAAATAATTTTKAKAKAKAKKKREMGNKNKNKAKDKTLGQPPAKKRKLEDEMSIVSKEGGEEEGEEEEEREVKKEEEEEEKREDTEEEKEDDDDDEEEEEEEEEIEDPFVPMAEKLPMKKRTVPVLTIYISRHPIAGFAALYGYVGRPRVHPQLPYRRTFASDS